jgi:endonuclease/exonuclease/phosphatase family metal-dependent hydrolase
VSHRDDRRTDGHPLWPRDCVELHVTAGRRRVALVMSHFSSALSDDGTRRAEQAARMRALADGLGVAHPDALVLAGGDLNDSPGSPALAPLLQDGEWHEVVAPAAWTWSSGSRGARLDYLLVAREDMGAVLQGAVVEGTDVLEASDHRPVVADLRIF